MVNTSFAGRTAIVTGSGRNIGRAIALALAARGAAVVVNGHRDAQAVDAVVREIEQAGGRALGVMADVSSHEQVAELVRKTIAVRARPRSVSQTVEGKRLRGDEFVV